MHMIIPKVVWILRIGTGLKNWKESAMNALRSDASNLKFTLCSNSYPDEPSLHGDTLTIYT